jgi:hypothetical protein
MRALNLAASLVLVALAAATNTASAQASNDPDVAARRTDLPAPKGWTMRFDRANADRAALAFGMAGDEMRVTSGPAAIYWAPSNTTSGPFTLEATFTQLRKPAHPEAYGLVWGGTDLDAANQAYYYLIVRGDGKYMVKHRAGAETHELVPWTDHAALVKEDAAGAARNALRVEATASGVRLFANGQLLRALPADATADGVAGVRVNHNLDVAIGGFAVGKP